MSGIAVAALNALKSWYRKDLGKALSKYGLRYEDIILADHPDVEKALNYLPEKERILRERRIKRAMHLSLNHDYLPEEIQKIQTPFKRYMKEEILQQRALREEREKLKNF